MYGNSYGAASSLSNNPFIDDPTNSRNRFPDISATLSSPTLQTTTTQYTSSWVNSQPSGLVQQQTYPQYQQQQPQQIQYQPTGFGSGSPPFQSALGQQFTSPISGSSYSYLTGQPTQPQAQSYNPAQQQIISNPGYVAQFDPYSSISQGWDGSSVPPAQTQSFAQTTVTSPSQLVTPSASISSVGSFLVPSSQQIPTTSRSSNGTLHPREFVKVHKVQVESWDGYTWKQLLNTFESLKDAWEIRKKELVAKVSQLQQQMQLANYYQAQQIQQEGSRVHGTLKEAETNFDSVTASVFQMREVYGGYRQSGDLASKTRVREATNAALKTLPDWPSQFY